MESIVKREPCGYAPDCLIFEIIKNNHAFIKKSGHKTFSLESHNVIGKNSATYTGFCHKPAVNISLGSAGTKIYYDSRHLKKTRRPQRMSKTIVLTKSLDELKRLRTLLRNSRPDVAKDVLVKFAKLTRAKCEEKSE
ncbi:Ribosomal L28e-Mak16 [Babesia duncani]|uniref:Ribosomal L28e-Mak16 n=1 Tax=Babesia duncani TaxID=323732 RepID=A0AAD9UNT9_9APIC|nr:Ribosomal L28e-Mak16 [Babesia duncani]